MHEVRCTMYEERCLEQCAVLQTDKLPHTGIYEGHRNVLKGRIIGYLVHSDYGVGFCVCCQARCTISALLNVLPHGKNQHIECMYVFM